MSTYSNRRTLTSSVLLTQVHSRSLDGVRVRLKKQKQIGDDSLPKYAAHTTTELCVQMGQGLFLREEGEFEISMRPLALYLQVPKSI